MIKLKRWLLAIIAALVCIAVINVIIFFIFENKSEEHIAQKYYDKIYNESELDGHELVAQHEQFEVTKFDLRFKKYAQDYLVEARAAIESFTSEQALDEILKEKLIRLEAESYGIAYLEDDWNAHIESLRIVLANIEPNPDSINTTQQSIAAWAQSADLTVDELITSQHFKEYIQSGWFTMQLSQYLLEENMIQHQHESDQKSLEQQSQATIPIDAFNAYVDELLQTHKANIEIIDLNI